MTEELEQRSPEWHEARRGRVTASMVGAILGVSPHGNRETAMRRMVRDYLGLPSDFEGNIATSYGTRNEPGALIEYEMETGHKVQAVGFITREDWAGCSPDGLIGEDGGLEAKCPFGKRKDVNPDFKTIKEQLHYYAQVQFSMWVTQRDWWSFFQWSPTSYKLDAIARDDDWLDENLPKLRQFHAEFLDELKDPQRHIDPLRKVIDTPAAHKIIAEYDQLSEVIDNATERRKELLSEMATMSGGVNALFAGRNLTKVERAGSVSYAKAMAKYAPDADLEPFRGKASTYWQVK